MTYSRLRESSSRSLDPAERNAEGRAILFDEVVREERDCIGRLHQARAPDGQGGERFSLAFSGGGIRAAAFQAGVLWRLARENRLKDVEYFAAVSGGGYITSAFASHLLGTDPPEPGNVKEWYLDVVARTLCRMQHNAGDFVRDCAADGNERYEKGAGWLPRSFDLPILLVVVALTLIVNPVVFFTSIFVPTSIFIELFFAAGMRAAFCANSEHDLLSRFQLMRRWTPIDHLAMLTFGFMVASFTVFILKSTLPCCRRPVNKKGLKRPEATPGFLFGHALSNYLVRVTVLLLGLMVFVCMVPALQVLTYRLNANTEMDWQNHCQYYREYQHQVGGHCSDYFGNASWYDDVEGLMVNSTPVTNASVASLEKLTLAEDGQSKMHIIFQLSVMMWKGLGIMLLLSICFMPFLGTKLLKDFLQAAGPLVVFMLACTYVLYNVFGPITHGDFGFVRRFEHGEWCSMITLCLTVAMILQPFYEEIRATFHTYYKRCLKQNFFLNGRDVMFTQVATNPYCPFILLTGTSSDFQPPGDVDTISELSFTGLHTGSEETGYVQMPRFRSLAKCTALTGAGCLDAISLSMSEALTMRFWLEVLNLSWGDYILFETKSIWIYELLMNWVGHAGGTNTRVGHVSRCLHRLPTSLMSLLVLVWFSIGWSAQHSIQPLQERCVTARFFTLAGVATALALVTLGFFSYTPRLSLFALSSMIRQFQQVTRFYFVGKTPPRMLYVTDGGVRDCTAVVQLLRRRTERILLVLAAADPKDELGVFRAALDVACEERLAAFFDPEDPRRDLRITYEQFQARKDAPYLHLGISYCWDEAGDMISGEMRTGHLYVVKNRLPTEFELRSVQPLLSEEEIRSSAEAWSAQPDTDLTADALGPFGCCDCCHENGLNCGPKFPHGSFTGYLYLTPQWFNCLARLGFELAGQAIADVTRADPKGTEEAQQARLERWRQQQLQEGHPRKLPGGCFAGEVDTDSSIESESSDDEDRYAPT